MEIDILDRIRMIDMINSYINVIGEKEKNIQYNEHFDIFSFFHELPDGRIIEFDCDKYGNIYGSFGKEDDIKFYHGISYQLFPMTLQKDVIGHLSVNPGE